MSYAENRVRVVAYGSLAGDSPLLVAVPTAPGHVPQKLHVLAARKLDSMSAAVAIALGYSLLVASGWRPHRWQSRRQYEDELAKRYGRRLEESLGKPPTREQVIAYGQKFLGYDSPHETGLAMDLGCGGLAPVSATIAEQRKTPLHLWLVEHAWEHGFTPYKAEPWHWEMCVSMADYLAGIST